MKKRRKNSRLKRYIKLILLALGINATLLFLICKIYHKRSIVQISNWIFYFAIINIALAGTGFLGRKQYEYSYNRLMAKSMRPKNVSENWDMEPEEVYRPINFTFLMITVSLCLIGISIFLPEIVFHSKKILYLLT